MEAAIKKAVEGGYDETKKEGTQYFKFTGEKRGNKKVWRCTPIEEILLDKFFWQTLGKALGWEEELLDVSYTFWTYEDELKITLLDRWENEMHSFIQYLIEGKDADSFFTNLIK